MNRSIPWWKSVFVVAAFAASAMAADPVRVAQDHVRANLTTFGLTNADISDWPVKNSFKTKHNGVSHVYFVQRVGGIEVFNGIMNVSVSNSEQVLNVGSRFVPNVTLKANTLSPLFDAATAVKKAADEVGANSSRLSVVSASVTGDRKTIFAKAPGFSLENVEAKLMLLPRASGAVRLVWQVVIEPDQEHIWHVSVDAVNGAILHKMNLVHTDSYKVYALPAESPSHVRNFPLPPGDGRSIVTESAANPVASPFGWHDLNGLAGADTADLSGNNVNAQTDVDNTNAYVPGADVRPLSVTRDFNYVLDLNRNPDTYREAVVTNLFYWNNVLHDILHLYGFDEPSGNFQLNNYGRGGLGGDAVEADAQDGSGTNNANFGTRPEGLAPRMQMYVWTPRIANQVFINSPEGLGPYPASGAAFGAPLTEAGITGDVVLMNDGVGTTSDGCQATSQNLSGKIAMIDRGGCNFTAKVQNAQNAGATAAIIVNNVPGDPITMGATDPTQTPSISSVMIRLEAGSELKAQDAVNATMRNVSAAIPNRDSDLDNGVIAHEYGHGVSIRLTGGASTVTCLSSEQQGGEGWSDFQALVTTARATDTATMPRGIGTYVIYQDTTGGGIRPFPYTTDMKVNPQTYGDLAKGTLSVPHGVGSVWATTLWDMYWAIVGGVPELGLPGAGFRENLYDMTAPLAGNQIAFQLMMDGLKLQPCNPTFLDARDAILLADRVNNGGKFQCHIWWAFARRGMGVNALDGDGTLKVTQDFTRPQACSNSGTCTVAPTFEGVKSVTPASDGVCRLTVAWDPAKDNCSTTGVTYTVYRSTDSFFTPSASNQLVSGLMGTSYNDSSVTNGTRYFYIVRASDASGNMDLNTVRKSERPVGGFRDGGVFQDDAGDTTPLRFTPSAASGWTVRTTGGVGNSAVYATSAAGLYASDSCLALESDTVYLSESPRLAFSSSYAIEPAWDGGIVEVSTADGGFANWTKLATLAYPGVMAGPIGDTACSNSGLRDGERAFNGTSDGVFVPFIALLDEFKNKAVRIRFVFGSDGASEDLGWFLDDIRIDGVRTADPCNAGPVAEDDRATTAEDVSVGVAVLANDRDDGGDPLTVTSVSQPANGRTSINSNNTITYTPNANFNGIDSFEYTISDGRGGSDSASVTVTVSPVNDAPAAANDTATAVKNSSVNVNVLGNDRDIDGDSLTVASATQGSNGTTSINPDGTVRYTPRRGFKGNDSFQYTISDGKGGSATASVAVRVLNNSTAD